MFSNTKNIRLAMAYILQNTDILKLEVIIPEATVQTMDSSNAFTLISTNNEFSAAPIACFITMGANQTTPYSGFTHLHLANGNNYTVGDICATYAANASTSLSLDTGGFYGLLCNFQATPNRFGGFNGVKDLQIFFDVLPVAGDGDMKVILYYTKLIV
jgi:hypothetical protein